MILRLILAVVLGAVVLSGCAPGEPHRRADIAPGVSTTWLARNLDDESLVLLDVRSDPMLFESGHLPGALHLALPGVRHAPGEPAPIPYPLLMNILRRHGVHAGAHVVVYSAGTGKAESIARLLVDAGHERVSVLEGGLERWNREGRPVATRAPSRARVVPGASLSG